MLNLETPNDGLQFDGEGQGELPEEIARLEEALEQIAQRIRDMGVSVDGECRLVADEYRNAGFGSEEIDGDNAEVRRLEDIFAQKRLKEGGLEKSFALGEQMEMFCTALLNKFFAGRFVVVRSSRFDDIKNHIDYVIFDPKTGDIVGAFDAVVAGEGNFRLDEKEIKVIKENFRKNGGELKYGLGMDGDGRITKCSRKNIPVFFLNLSGDDLRDYLRKVNYSAPKMGKEENAIIDDFLGSMCEQIDNFTDFKLVDGNEGIFKKIKSIYAAREYPKGFAPKIRKDQSYR